VGIYENDVAALLHYYQPDMPSLLKGLSKFVNEVDGESWLGQVWAGDTALLKMKKIIVVDLQWM
jgi:hypothetical protein